MHTRRCKYFSPLLASDTQYVQLQNTLRRIMNTLTYNNQINAQYLNVEYYILKHYFSKMFLSFTDHHLGYHT